MAGLQTGSSIGPYEILGPIGAGGMGEVYRAKDPRLGREVAIKVLPSQFSADPDRLRRFEQEARAAGILNHPNILTVYDIGVQEDSPYVVSELLVGETLRERIGGSALNYRKAIEYALQIAHGLAAAHDKGIVHRDLKPENIFVTRDGRIKILDFGLAKLTIPEPVSGGRSNLMTVDPGTQPGMVLGTVGYMSPEQVRGREVDHRSDLFSFGAILYEMVTGRRAFHRDSTADTMSAILKEDPVDPSSTNKNVPGALERIIRHCLEKNAEERFQSARDLAFDLEMISGISGLGIADTTAEQAERKGFRASKLTPVLLLIAGVIAGGITTFFLTRIPTTRETPTFQRLTFRRGYISASRFAPDRQTILYSAAWGGFPSEVFSTRPQTPASRSLNLQRSELLAISSTGEMAILMNSRFILGWQRTGTLARVPIDGGAPREIVENVQDADWTPDGRELAVVRNVPGKRRLEFPIGKIIFETAGWVSNLRFSSDGKSIAAIEHPQIGDDRGMIVAFDLNGNKKVLTTEASSASGLAWSPDGKEIWFTASELGSNQQPLRAVTLSGQKRIVYEMAGNLVLNDVLATGEVLALRDDRRREMIGFAKGDNIERDLSWFDWAFPRDISEDGKFVLFEEQGAGGGHNYSVYLRAMDGSPAIRLGDGYASSLSPDGKWALATLPGVQKQHTILPTGAGQAKTLNFPAMERVGSGASAWFSDGKRILMPGAEPGHQSRLWMYDLESEKLRPVTPEGIAGVFLLSTDDKFLLAACIEGGYCLYPVLGGEPKKVAGLDSQDVVAGWTTDPDTIYALQRNSFPVRLETVNLSSGERKLWKEIVPPDLAGALLPINIQITPDGSAYAYTYRRVLSDLFLIKGLK
jgi:eukaryotic-like serine/threonine-protein kinase